MAARHGHPVPGLTLDVIRDLMARRTGAGDTPVGNPTWISEFRVHCRMVDRYRSGLGFPARLALLVRA